MALSDHQLYFLLSMSSNAACNQDGYDLGPRALRVVTQRLEKVPGDWEIVWGPGVHQVRKGLAPAQVMYVAFSKKRKEYFISVAGKNPNDLYSWICQDFGVAKVERWPFNFVGAGVQLSLGTYQGLQALQNMVPESSLPGEGFTLQEYLGRKVMEKKKMKVIAGGHSLGGALAPAYALWLFDTALEWDPELWVTEYQTYSFGAPSAGLKPYTEYLNDRIPKSYRSDNTLDLVPHAWDKETMAKLADLYAPQITPSKHINEATQVAQLIPLWHDYGQLKNRRVKNLKGQVNESLNGVDETRNYMIQAVYQHNTAYYELMDLVDYIPKINEKFLEKVQTARLDDLRARVFGYKRQRERLEEAIAKQMQKA